MLKYWFILTTHASQNAGWTKIDSSSLSTFFKAQQDFHIGKTKALHKKGHISQNVDMGDLECQKGSKECKFEEFSIWRDGIDIGIGNGQKTMK